MNKLPTIEQVMSHVMYDPETGIFRYHPNKIMHGTMRENGIAGGIDKDGYRRITILRRGFRASRLAWLFIYGEWPPVNVEVDHINNDRVDNRKCNLRLSTRQMNSFNKPLFKNNTSGFKGVHYEPDRKKYRAAIGINGKKVKLGRFDTAEEAHAAYCKRLVEIAGEYANKG